MAFIWGTNGLHGFDYYYGNATSSTTTSVRDTTYVDSALFIENGTTAIKELDAEYADLWLHFEYYVSGSSSAFDSPLAYLGNSGIDAWLFRMGCTNGTLTVEYWNGSAWIATAITMSLLASTKYTFDLHVVMENSGGLIQLYSNGAQIGSDHLGDTIWTAATGLDRYAPYATLVSGGAYVSQMILATESTIGAKLVQHALSSDGDTSDWVGDYTDVNTSANSIIASDTLITSDTADQLQLANFDSLPAHSLYVRGLGINAIAKRGTTGPANLRAVVKTASTEYESASKALTIGYQSIAHIWEVNPNTTGDWSDAEIAAAQIGVKSKT